MRSMAITGDTEDTLMVLLTLADECSMSDNIDRPAQMNCMDFDEAFFPEYTGADCDVQCIYGTYDEDQPTQCACE